MKKNYSTRVFGKLILIYLFSIFLFSQSLHSQLTGTYTIGTSGNYATFSAAVTALSSQGISGPVVFNVAAGDYNEQISIPPITGASATNTITFQSASGDNADVTIFYNPATTGANYTIHLAGVDYMFFKNLSIFSTGASDFGNIIKITNNIKFVEFIGNHFYGKTGTCTFKDKYLIRDDSGSRDTNVVFINNKFEHGNGALYMEYLTDFIIDSNSYVNGENFYIYLSFLEDGIIEENTINGSLKIYYPYGNSSNVIRNNIITEGIDLSGISTTEGKEAIVYNNFVKGGFFIQSCNYTKVFNNTVLHTSNYPIYIDNACNHISVVNNIFKSNNASYAAMYIGELADIDSLDYNNFYSTGANLVKLNTTNYSTLADWQTSSGGSANSYNQNVTFVNEGTTDLHLSSGNPNLFGIRIPGLTRDIDEQLKNPKTPNIGADEYSALPMTGTYTIGKSGTEHFTSFTEAIEALIYFGVSDFTYFQVSTGTYEEQISIPSITGASTNAGIVFYPKSGNRKDVILTYTIDDVDKNYIVNMAGADYIHFQKIEFVINPRSNYGVIFDFNGNAAHNGITYCDFTGLNIANQGYTYSILYSKYNGSNDSYNIISDNTFKYGSIGVYFSGLSPSSMELGNIISNNNFQSQYYAAINLVFQDSCTVKSDTINITSAHINPYGVYLMYCKREMVFNNNIKIASTALTAGGYGIYDYFGTGEYNKRASIFNNFIKIVTSNGTVSGITLNNTPYRDIYYNTVDISGLNLLSQAFRVINVDSEAFYSNNNIFSNRAGGYAFYTDAPSIFASNYNNFYSTGTVLIKSATTECETLGEWQTLASRDADSYSVDPRFISNDNMHIYHANKYFNTTGLYVATGNSNIDYYLIRDIDLETRGNPSDIGADEFNYISEENDFLTYSFAQQTGDAIINTENHTISIEVEYGTGLSSLVATFTISEDAAVAIGLNAQTSGVTANDFSSPVIYTISAEDGTQEEWTVTVTSALNNETDFLEFIFAEQNGDAVINSTEHSIEIEVVYGTDITDLIAIYTLSPEAIAKIGEVNQESGVTSNDFSSDVIYTVIAENGDEQEWTVTVTVVLNTENDILSFGFAEQSAAAVINSTEHTVTIQVVPETSLSSLVATYTISGDAKAYVNEVEQTSGVTSNDFSNSVIYKVVAQDGSEQNWTVTATVAQYSGNEILTYSFTEQISAAIINSTAHTVSINVNSSADLSSLIATFTLSTEATATVSGVPQVSETTANNFTSPVTYRVTAQDATHQDWTVTVSKSTDIDNFKKFNLAIYPNPAVDYIQIESSVISNSWVTIEIIDITGKVNYSQRKYSESNLNLILQLPSEINSGMYFINIKTNDQKISKRLIVK